MLRLRSIRLRERCGNRLVTVFEAEETARPTEDFRRPGVVAQLEGVKQQPVCSFGAARAPAEALMPSRGVAVLLSLGVVVPEEDAPSSCPPTTPTRPLDLARRSPLVVRAGSAEGAAAASILRVYIYIYIYRCELN